MLSAPEMELMIWVLDGADDAIQHTLLLVDHDRRLEIAVADLHPIVSGLRERIITSRSGNVTPRARERRLLLWAIDHALSNVSLLTLVRADLSRAADADGAAADLRRQLSALRTRLQGEEAP